MGSEIDAELGHRCTALKGLTRWASMSPQSYSDDGTALKIPFHCYPLGSDGLTLDGSENYCGACGR